VPTVATAFFPKQFLLGNANGIMNPGDFADIGNPGLNWACVVCQYEDKVVAHPALSTFGTALLVGGLVTAMLYELRRRQPAGSA
jgi:hypothetical protein